MKSGWSREDKPDVPDLSSGGVDDAERVLRQRWLVRVIVSLLTDPAENDAEERTLVERFVVPGVMEKRRR